MSRQSDQNWSSIIKAIGNVITAKKLARDAYWAKQQQADKDQEKSDNAIAVALNTQKALQDRQTAESQAKDSTARLSDPDWRQVASKSDLLNEQAVLNTARSALGLAPITTLPDPLARLKAQRRDDVASKVATLLSDNNIDPQRVQAWQEAFYPGLLQDSSDATTTAQPVTPQVNPVTTNKVASTVPVISQSTAPVETGGMYGPRPQPAAVADPTKAMTLLAGIERAYKNGATDYATFPMRKQAWSLIHPDGSQMPDGWWSSYAIAQKAIKQNQEDHALDVQAKKQRMQNSADANARAQAASDRAAAKAANGTGSGSPGGSKPMTDLQLRNRVSAISKEKQSLLNQANKLKYITSKDDDGNTVTQPRVLTATQKTQLQSIRTRLGELADEKTSLQGQHSTTGQASTHSGSSKRTSFKTSSPVMEIKAAVKANPGYTWEQFWADVQTEHPGWNRQAVYDAYLSAKKATRR